MKNCMTSVWMTLEKFGVTMPVLQQGTSLAVEIENEYNYICIENHCGVLFFLNQLLMQKYLQWAEKVWVVQ